ncbi:hypothetical protein DAPPUDRAFT_113646 [Daphnia pulex]|uniref:Uncharacterized protein n=1 Tax=Daphnia pulex TaxID=6669 RepID=E9HFN2_DAPPU|nr:hypothetical protein DAPPUDRAFT_113646 [Daphnia pulex]|eukprot:EFX69473.1 hypothetical protein DAPPUDRAFT_113646 [Daphnia pulex]
MVSTYFKRKGIGILNFLHRTIPRNPDIQFHEHFRMSRATFQDILTEFGEAVEMGHRGEHNEVPFQLKLLVTIWWLGNQETFRQIADRFSTTRDRKKRKLDEQFYHIIPNVTSEQMKISVDTLGSVDVYFVRSQQTKRHNKQMGHGYPTGMPTRMPRNRKLDARAIPLSSLLRSQEETETRDRETQTSV